MLVVVEHRNIAALFELLFNLKASGRGDILQIHAAERACQQRNGIDDVIDILAAHAKRNGVHTAEGLEEHALTLHDRHAGLRADIAEAEDCCAVGYNSHRVPAAGQIVALVDVLLDFQAGLGNAGRVGQRQRFLVVDRCARRHFEFAFPLIVFFQRFCCVIHTVLSFSYCQIIFSGRTCRSNSSSVKSPSRSTAALRLRFSSKASLAAFAAFS